MYDVFTDGARAIDLVGNDGRGFYSGLDFDQLAKTYTHLEIAPARAAAARIALAACTEPVEISREQFERTFECGAFMGWTRTSTHESFRCAEPNVGNVHMAWVRVGDRCFKLQRPIHDSHLELVARCEQKIRIQAAASMFN